MCIVNKENKKQVPKLDNLDFKEKIAKVVSKTDTGLNLTNQESKILSNFNIKQRKTSLKNVSVRYLKGACIQ